MSDQFVGTDGYKPMILPATGEELLEGRQYLLTPLARVILLEEFGLSNVPTVVECIHRKVARTRLTTVSENLETGAVSESVITLEGQMATFRAFLKKGSVLKFTVDLVKLEALVPFYNESHKLPEMEEEWFAVVSKYPKGKFRGCTLRWWRDGAVEGRVRLGSSFRKSGPVDLSILDLA